MSGENSAGLGGGGMRAALVPGVVCAVISIVIMRTGFMGLFFLVPLGYAAAAYNSTVAWLACLTAVGINVVLSLGVSLFVHGSMSGMSGPGLDILYFTVLALGFTWIMAGGIVSNVRTAYRFIVAAVAGALAFLAIVMAANRDPVFSGIMREQVELIASAYIASMGADAARQSFMEQMLTPERIMHMITSIALRGGAMVSAFFLLFISRQGAYVILRLFRWRRVNVSGELGYAREPSSARELGLFHAPPNTIWVLSVSLPVVLLSRLIKTEAAEIIAWNVLIICAILFLAQGGGIVLHTLSRRPMPPLLRLLCNVLIIVLIFSPGINMLVLGGLVLLGIAENWLPLRAPKTNGSASTPGL